MERVTITRRPLAHPPGRRGAAWIYTYQVGGDAPVEYGTHLASLRARLKSRYPGFLIICDWK